MILTQFFLEHAVFMRLYDVCTALPPYEEEVMEVEMGQEQAASYTQFEKDLLAEVSHALAKGSNSMLIEMARSLTGERENVSVSAAWNTYKRQRWMQTVFSPKYLKTSPQPPPLPGAIEPPGSFIALNGE